MNWLHNESSRETIQMYKMMMWTHKLSQTQSLKKWGLKDKWWREKQKAQSWEQWQAILGWQTSHRASEKNRCWNPLHGAGSMSDTWRATELRETGTHWIVINYLSYQDTVMKLEAESKHRASWSRVWLHPHYRELHCSRTVPSKDQQSVVNILTIKVNMSNTSSTCCCSHINRVAHLALPRQ